MKTKVKNKIHRGFCFLFTLILTGIFVNFLLGASIEAENIKPTAIEKKIQVAAHRGDWRNFADNSIEGIESCIKMGVDIVEIDVALTKDSVLILMHDKTVNRTTNGKGAVKNLTFDEIKELNLRNGLGRVTEYKVPTFEEVMQVAKDKILVNVDKADEYFDLVFEVLQKTGTVHQVIIKSDKPYATLLEKYGSPLQEMIFMPVVNLTNTFNASGLETILNSNYPFYEIVFKDAEHPLLKELIEGLKAKGATIWINSLWPSLCGGYSDDRAVNNPDATWGYLIKELGATILQTDRPFEMLKWLREKQ